jgi:hypothetical protein
MLALLQTKLVDHLQVTLSRGTAQAGTQAGLLVLAQEPSSYLRQQEEKVKACGRPHLVVGVPLPRRIARGQDQLVFQTIAVSVSVLDYAYSSLAQPFGLLGVAEAVAQALHNWCPQLPSMPRACVRLLPQGAFELLRHPEAPTTGFTGLVIHAEVQNGVIQEALL